MPFTPSSSQAARHAAVYCWLTAAAERRGGPPVIGLELQEELARAQASRLGLTLAAHHVFTDHRAPVLPRPTPGPSSAASPVAATGWDALLSAARAARFGHLFLHDALRLERHPCALAELLALADSRGLRLYGHPLDLNDPAVREDQRERAERAGRAALAASARSRSAGRAAAAAGRPHGGGLRRFGYTPGMAALVDGEAAVVREVFARFLAGASLRALALDLNHRGIPTAYGRSWTVGGVGRLLDAPRYAGLPVLDGELVPDGEGAHPGASWPACVSVDDWRAARLLRRRRAEELAAGRRPRRAYPLTSLVRCTRCERHMVGSTVGSYPTYACTANSSLVAEHCSRHIGAESLEAHVAERAIALLEALTDPPECRALDGVTSGTEARFGWARLSTARRATVFRHFFATVRIGASSTGRSVFDPSRIELVPRPRPTLP
ncbi:hypothetical protein GCM10009665_52740 [Kitasatospora nipponensis]|uniref:Recombinase domain-containing protein n=1 Tax=Kitasatospora nipponensis TaxID=258049 RepID=A0ABN1WR15_9ACTN